MNFNMEFSFLYVKKDERYFWRYKIISKCCCLNGSYFIVPELKLKPNEEKTAQRSIDGFEFHVVCVCVCKITHLTFAICENQNADLLKYNLFEWQIINSKEDGGREKANERQIDFIKSMFWANVQLRSIYKMAAKYK